MLVQAAEHAEVFCVTTQIFVFFPEEEKVGVKTIKTFAERMRNEGVSRAIMVTMSNMTPFARQCLAEMAPKYYIEVVRLLYATVWCASCESCISACTSETRPWLRWPGKSQLVWLHRSCMPDAACLSDFCVHTFRCGGSSMQLSSSSTSRSMCLFLSTVF